MARQPFRKRPRPGRVIGVRILVPPQRPRYTACYAHIHELRDRHHPARLLQSAQTRAVRVREVHEGGLRILRGELLRLVSERVLQLFERSDLRRADRVRSVLHRRYGAVSR